MTLGTPRRVRYDIVIECAWFRMISEACRVRRQLTVLGIGLTIIVDFRYRKKNSVVRHVRLDPPLLFKMVIGRRGRGRAVGRGSGGRRGGTLAGEPALSQGSVEVAPVPVVPEQLGFLPTPVVPGVSAEMRKFMESFAASFQQARSPAVKEFSYLEQLQKYRHPTFFGNLVPSEAETWLKSIEKTLNVMKCLDKQQVTLATYLLQGEADRWWDTAKRSISETPILWSSFEDQFFRQYVLQSYKDACILEFYSLEQGDMNIARYDQRFNELSRYVPFIVHDEEQKKMKFLKGLRPYFRRFLITLEASTYANVLSKALALEQNNLEDCKPKDMRSQQRQDPRPDKSKAVQEQFGGSGSKRQRLGFDSSVPTRVVEGQQFERSQLSSGSAAAVSGSSGKIVCLGPAGWPLTACSGSAGWPEAAYVRPAGWSKIVASRMAMVQSSVRNEFNCRILSIKETTMMTPEEERFATLEFSQIEISRLRVLTAFEKGMRNVSPIFNPTQHTFHGSRRVILIFKHEIVPAELIGRIAGLNFGVLLLEIVAGKKNTIIHDYGESLSLLGYTWNSWKENKVEEILHPDLSKPCFLIEILRCVQVGVLCLHDFSDDRPIMSSVLSMLTSETGTLPTPMEPFAKWGFVILVF
ncbi:hypothetical protein GIB67_002587 [Kingdonia uniflora]|uniref:Retrotransposon gag domain-containing protein n=1 Tax=Kingdonia uniflora TaxID=39325 RepID=A0A7J7N427_9MAGN|nr:hypothetical protein GIB67_002587 [Kingdonia uniflora]